MSKLHIFLKKNYTQPFSIINHYTKYKLLKLYFSFFLNNQMIEIYKNTDLTITTKIF